MTACVQIGDTVAMVKDQIWYAPEPMKQALESTMPDGGPGGADPNPDATAADRAAKVFSGKVLWFDEPEFDPKVVY